MISLLDRGPPSAPRSLYLHVPFCTDRCTYCAFATIADRPSLHEDLVAALGCEFDRQYQLPEVLDTIYLGGGTPGLLAPTLLRQLLRQIRRRVSLAPDAEVTLEVNPANVTREALAAWTDLGITRLSMGIQTFDDPVLAKLGRHHSGADGRQALDQLGADWPGAWSADLLVGWHGQKAGDLTRDLEDLLARRPPHVSVYGLTIEPGTPLQDLSDLGKKVRLEDAHLDLLDPLWSQHLLSRGYERYEVSNFALPNARSRHNQVYWRNEDFLGMGPGASSSLHPLRWSNVRDTLSYMSLLNSGRSPRQHVERLTPPDRLLESLGVGLRTSDGLFVSELDRRFGEGWRLATARGLGELTQAGLLEEADGRLRIPAEAMTRVDSITSVLARTLD